MQNFVNWIFFFLYFMFPLIKWRLCHRFHLNTSNGPTWNFVPLYCIEVTYGSYPLARLAVTVVQIESRHPRTYLTMLFVSRSVEVTVVETRPDCPVIKLNGTWPVNPLPQDERISTCVCAGTTNHFFFVDI